MTSYHVIHYVTVFTCLFIVQNKKESQKKRKEKENQNKISEFKHTMTILVWFHYIRMYSKVYRMITVFRRSYSVLLVLIEA